jgi:hypothetical protein
MKLSQAELFGVNDTDKIKTDDHGIGLHKDADPMGTWKIDPTDRKTVTDLIMSQIRLMYGDADRAYENGDKIGASPLPWHWEEGGGGVINVYDARGAIVFENVNGKELGIDRDWVNVELMVACVNKFASMITPDELDRLRKKQVYGDENKQEAM